MFKATKMPNRKLIESIKVQNNEGKFVTEPNDALEIITKFFKKKFVDENIQEIETITNCFNNIFETHENLEIHSGDMITPLKPGKLKGPNKNLRPLTLLNTIRKSLSTIALERIRPAVLKYISSGQSGFQPNRSAVALYGPIDG